MSQHSQYIPAIVAATGATALAIHLYMKSRKALPDTWSRVGTVADIYVYPIKSCAPVKVEKAECTVLGLKEGWLRDRTLMVVDDKYNFVTARARPQLYLVQPSFNKWILTLQHKDMEPLHLDLAEIIATEKPQVGQVWSVPVPILDCGIEASKWISAVIDGSISNFRLVYYASQTSRPRVGTSLEDGAEKVYKFTKNDMGAFPDDVSYNMINAASVEELNTRLANSKASSRQFRPNFVVKGARPYDEDSWRFVRIRHNVFEIIKPCTRCIMTTMDPDTGMRNPDTEPLKTLRSYRLVEDAHQRKVEGNAPRMGVQMALRSGSGTVARHDHVYVAYK